MEDNREQGNVYFFIALFLLLISFFYLRGLQQTEIVYYAPVPQEALVQVARTATIRPQPTEAQSVYVYDVDDKKVLYSKHSTTIFPIASLTKIMTALAAVEILGRDASVPVSRTAVSEPGDQGLLVDSIWQVDTLVALMLVASSNDAAYALAEHAGKTLSDDTGDPVEQFVSYMNNRATALGLHSTVFFNPSGLDRGTERAGGAYSSAQDISRLLEYALQTIPDVMTYTTRPVAVFQSENGSEVEAENTNVTVNKLPGIVASKTGYTDGAGGSVTVFFNRGVYDPMIVTILSSSFDGRFADMESLIRTIIYYPEHE